MSWVPGRSFKTFAISWVKAMVFPVVMYGCESWTIKKAERWRIDASELWCWKRLLRVRWTARRSNQSILKEISPGCSLEGLMLKLKLQYFGHLMRRTDSFEKTRYWERLRARGEWDDDRGCDGWMSSRLNGHGFEWTPGLGDGQGGVACCSPWGHKELDTTDWLNRTDLSDRVFVTLVTVTASGPLTAWGLCFPSLNSRERESWSMASDGQWRPCDEAPIQTLDTKGRGSRLTSTLTCWASEMLWLHRPGRGSSVPPPTSPYLILCNTAATAPSRVLWVPQRLQGASPLLAGGSEVQVALHRTAQPQTCRWSLK